MEHFIPSHTTNPEHTSALHVGRIVRPDNFQLFPATKRREALRQAMSLRHEAVKLDTRRTQNGTLKLVLIVKGSEHSFPSKLLLLEPFKSRSTRTSRKIWKMLTNSKRRKTDHPVFWFEACGISEDFRIGTFDGICKALRATMSISFNHKCRILQLHLSINCRLGMQAPTKFVGREFSPRIPRDLMDLSTALQLIFQCHPHLCS